MSRRNRKRAKATNSRVVSSAGQGQAQDHGNNARIQRSSSHPLDRTRSASLQSHEWGELYYKEWTARKIVDIPVQDILRKGWTYGGLDDDQACALTSALSKLQFNRALRQALKLERLVGGAVIVMGLRSDGDASKPVNHSAISKGDLIFTNVIPRSRVSQLEYDTNPLSARFGKPETYHVIGQSVHHSRLLIFDGDPLTDNEATDIGFIKGSYDGFGVSVLAAIYDDIIRSVSARQSAMQLIQRASIVLINNGSLKAQLSTTGGADALAALQTMTDQMSMYQAAMIDGKEINIDQWSASFGGVPELLQQFLQIISAASDIPATRFLGEAPGGLNASGKSDLENYYNAIDDGRESRLRPQLEKFLRVAIPSILPDVDSESVEIEFPPMWSPSESESATTRGADSTALTNLVLHDVITSEQALEALSVLGHYDFGSAN